MDYFGMETRIKLINNQNQIVIHHIKPWTCEGKKIVCSIRFFVRIKHHTFVRIY